jgi:protein-L-isoaspartate(D-aspartate) O-methyltransferase
MTPFDPGQPVELPSSNVTPQLRDADSATNQLRERLIAHLKQSGTLTQAPVEVAMRAVPRHLFLPEEAPERAYADESVVTKWNAEQLPISSASQPAMVAIMLEQLDVRPGMRVLEIGAGTGYNAALLAELVGPSGQVTTIDLDTDTATTAAQHLVIAGYGPDRVTVICGDGALGWPERAPYDRIILTVGAWSVSREWLAQLAPQGRFVLPLGLHTIQLSAAFEQQGEAFVSTSLRPCGFMRLRGPFAGPETLSAIPGMEGMKLLAEPPIQVSPHLADLLRSPARVQQLHQIIPDLLRYVLAFTARDVVTLFATPPHPLLGGSAIGIMTPEGDSACFIGSEATTDHAVPALVEYGAATAALAVEHSIHTWRILGRPALAQWRMRLLPTNGAVLAAHPYTFIFPKDLWVVELSVNVK